MFFVFLLKQDDTSTELGLIQIYRMIEKTASLGLAPVTCIMFALGTFMFLFPPVTRMPIYVALGIMLPAQGHALMGELKVDQML